MAWPNRKCFNWTDARLDRLSAAWLDGQSSSVIADELGTTRNSVMSQVSRLGLLGARRKTPASRMSRGGKNGNIVKRVQARQKVDFKAAAKKIADEIAAAESEPIGPRVSITQLTDSTCRWPYGDPLSESFCYCGSLTKSESPYCGFHYARAFTITPRQKLPVQPANGYVCQPSGVGGYDNNTLKPLSF